MDEEGDKEVEDKGQEKEVTVVVADEGQRAEVLVRDSFSCDISYHKLGEEGIRLVKVGA